MDVQMITSIGGQSEQSNFLRDTQRTLNINQKIKVDLQKTEYPIIRSVAHYILQYKQWCRTEQKQEASLIWSDTYVPEEIIKRLRPYQRINHFPGSEELGRKDRLAINLTNAKSKVAQHYDFFPQTWLLPRDMESFRKVSKECAEPKVYISKPEASSQGYGIKLFREIQQLPQNQSLVVQEYIDRPFLIENLKFDFRIYVLLRSINPLRIFIYQQGLSRFATHPYKNAQSSNLDNLMMHLTNYAINKKSPDFIFNKAQNEDNIGHKRSYSAVLKIIKAMGHNTEKLEQAIDMIIVKTIIAAESKLTSSYRSCRPLQQNVCFQILGFDIMLDQKLKPFLIQVNHSPSFTTDTPLDINIKKHLILDTLNLINLNYEEKKNYLIHKEAMKNEKLSSSQILSNNIVSMQYESTHCGAYRRIYPSFKPALNRIYDQIREVLIENRIRRRAQRVSLPAPLVGSLPKESRQRPMTNLIHNESSGLETPQTYVNMYDLRESLIVRKGEQTTQQIFKKVERRQHVSEDNPQVISDSDDISPHQKNSVKLTNINFETVPHQFQQGCTLSNLRLLKQYQQQQQFVRQSKPKRVIKITQLDRGTNDDDRLYRKRFKKVSLYNFQYNALIQQHMRQNSRQIMEALLLDVNQNMSQKNLHSKFNPVRNWPNAPKLRFHRIKNLKNKTPKNVVRPLSQDERKKMWPQGGD